MSQRLSFRATRSIATRAIRSGGFPRNDAALLRHPDRSYQPAVRCVRDTSVGTRESPAVLGDMCHRTTIDTNPVHQRRDRGRGAAELVDWTAGGAAEFVERGGEPEGLPARW